MRIPAGLTAIARNVRRNYAGRDRRAEYADLLSAAAGAGYEMVSLARFHDLATGGQDSDRRLLALRHDVDIRDVAGNEAFYEAELAVGARSTFYFRLSTAPTHRDLIRRLRRDGFEVGYHFEEAATLARLAGLTSRAQVEARRAEIADRFQSNCALFRTRWNPDLVSAASHGDWINRRLGFANHEFVTSDLLRACGLDFEAYGDELLGQVAAYVSDVAPAPSLWTRDYGLTDALRDARTPICMLTHERRWHLDRRANVDADLRRVVESLGYRWRMTLPPPP